MRSLPRTPLISLVFNTCSFLCFSTYPLTGWTINPPLPIIWVSVEDFFNLPESWIFWPYFLALRSRTFAFCTPIRLPWINLPSNCWIAWLASHSVLKQTKPNPLPLPGRLSLGKKDIKSWTSVSKHIKQNLSGYSLGEICHKQRPALSNPPKLRPHPHLGSSLCYEFIDPELSYNHRGEWSSNNRKGSKYYFPRKVNCIQVFFQKDVTCLSVCVRFLLESRKLWPIFW